MPLSVIASTTSAQVNGKLVRGREYSWGVAEGELFLGEFLEMIYKVILTQNTGLAGFFNS
jgi:hypothetical protein